jgi:hypothetical protein
MNETVMLEEELNNSNADFTEWYAVLCHYALHQAVLFQEDVARELYSNGYSPAEVVAKTIVPLDNPDTLVEGCSESKKNEAALHETE